MKTDHARCCRRRRDRRALAPRPTTHVIQAPKDAQWGPAPPFIPAGAQIAVLSGDPTKPVPYSVRLKFPANYAIPRIRTRPTRTSSSCPVRVTFGMGDKLVKGASANTTLAPAASR